MGFGSVGLARACGYHRSSFNFEKFIHFATCSNKGVGMDKKSTVLGLGWILVIKL